jgi:hypothetical protein
MTEEKELSLLEVEGLANVKIYAGLDLWAVRISEVPEPLQEPLNNFMIGQARPTVAGAELQDFIWLGDYHRFLLKLRGLYTLQKLRITR